MPTIWKHFSYVYFLVVVLLVNHCFAVAQKKDLFEDLSNEDYSETVESMVKPDGVDNEAIQQLIDKFLNKGTLEEIKEETVNKEAHQLINSSTYWNVQNLAPKYSISEVDKAQAWLNGYTTELQKVLHQVAVAGWSYFTSASPLTKQYLEEAEEVARAFLKASAQQGRQFSIGSNQSNPASLDSLLALITKEGMNALDATELENYNKVLARINQIFTATPLCELSSKEGTACLFKSGDLQSLLQTSQNAKDSFNWWKSWRMAAGPNLTDAYAELMQSTNKAAKENGFADGGAMWRSVFELPDLHGQPQVDIQGQIEQVYQQILPFYKQLHGYFRPRLASIYASKESRAPTGVTKDGPLPVHLLKSLNGENWSGHYELTRPFAEEDQRIDGEILENFRAQNYTVRTMFTKVYRFMKFLGFEKLPKSLWKKSVFVRNWSKDMICNPATAYDMVDGEDYRIKVCAQLAEPDFINAHKLMSQLYYKYLSRKQPLLLRDSPNPSLSSALAGAFAVLSKNTDYLKSQNLIDKKDERSEPTEINHLYKEAIDQLVQLPFTMVADKWRFEVFEGKLDKSNWAEAWWKMREQYQGVKSGDKSAASDYDSVVLPAIAQQHAPAMRSFVSYVAQFQILKKLCQGTNEIGLMLSQGCIPNKAAVKQIIDTLAKGASISWVNAFEEMTGSNKLDAGPLLQYYEPLISWLQNINQHEQVVLGWDGLDQQEFTQNEIPELRQVVGELGQVLPNDDQIAYPGKSCTKGQECLLDSICNGTICVCNASFYTLQIADTYNCVPENPANAGFGTPGGGLLIALNPNENAKMESKNNTAKEDEHHKVEETLKRTNSASSLSLFLDMTSVIVFTLVNALITMQCS